MDHIICIVSLATQSLSEINNLLNNLKLHLIIKVKIISRYLLINIT